MGQPSVTAADLCDEMRQVRSNMGLEVHELVENARGMVERARVLADWRYYLRKFPGTSLSLAAAAGYLLVPRREKVFQTDAGEFARLARKNGLVVKVEEPGAKAQTTAASVGGSGKLAPLVNLAVGIAMQRGLTLLEKQVAHLFESQLHGPPANGRSHQPSDEHA